MQIKNLPAKMIYTGEEQRTDNSVDFHVGWSTAGLAGEYCILLMLTPKEGAATNPQSGGDFHVGDHVSNPYRYDYPDPHYRC